MSKGPLTKAEIAVLGQRYAELLLRNARASPDSPLEKLAAWQNAETYARADMRRSVKGKAREILLEAGYPRTLVDNIFMQTR